MADTNIVLSKWPQKKLKVEKMQLINVHMGTHYWRAVQNQQRRATEIYSKKSAQNNRFRLFILMQYKTHCITSIQRLLLILIDAIN